MKVMIIEDEPKLAKSLIALLSIHCKELSVDFVAENLEKGKKYLKANEVDLIFLDLHLPDGNGLILVDNLNSISEDKRPSIIVTTAHDEYALEAINANVVDYLLKPIDADDLVEAVERATRFNRASSKSVAAPLDKLALFTSERVELVEISKIIRCQSSNNYTTFYLEGGKEMLISKPLKDVERLLEERGFQRVHQSHLINMSHFSSLEKQGMSIVIMSDKQEIVVSSTYKASLMEKLRSMSF